MTTTKNTDTFYLPYFVHWKLTLELTTDVHVCGCMNVYVYAHMQKKSPIIYVKSDEHKRNESCVYQLSVDMLPSQNTEIPQ